MNGSSTRAAGRAFGAAFAALAVVMAAAGASAMTMTVSGTQLIATGRIVPEDAARFRTLIDANPAVKTVVLENSPGGSASANDEITKMIEDHNLDTVVAGNCVSACAMIFLAGTNRAFGDLEPLAVTSLGFHGSYVRGELASERRLQALKARVLERTGNKINPALVDRWLHLDERNTIRFRAAPDTTANTPTVFYCAIGRYANLGDYGKCEAIPATNALASGIVTTSTIAHVER